MSTFDPWKLTVIMWSRTTVDVRGMPWIQMSTQVCEWLWNTPCIRLHPHRGHSSLLIHPSRGAPFSNLHKGIVFACWVRVDKSGFCTNPFLGWVQKGMERILRDGGIGSHLFITGVPVPPNHPEAATTLKQLTLKTWRPADQTFHS